MQHIDLNEKNAKWLVKMVKKELCREPMASLTIRNRAMFDMVAIHSKEKYEEQFLTMMGFILSFKNKMDANTLYDILNRISDEAANFLLDEDNAMNHYQHYLANYSAKLLEERSRNKHGLLNEYNRKSTPSHCLKAIIASKPNDLPDDLELLYDAARAVYTSAKSDGNTQEFKNKIITSCINILINPYDTKNHAELNKTIRENTKGRTDYKSIFIGAAIIFASVAVVGGLIAACILCPPMLAAFTGAAIYAISSTLIGATVIAGIFGIKASLAGGIMIYSAKESGTQSALKNMRTSANKVSATGMKLFKQANSEWKAIKKEEGDFERLSKPGIATLDDRSSNIESVIPCPSPNK